MELTEIKSENEPEKAVLISVDTGDLDAEASMNELEELAKTAGAVVLASVIQRREAPSPASYIGSGSGYRDRGRRINARAGQKYRGCLRRAHGGQNDPYT